MPLVQMGVNLLHLVQLQTTMPHLHENNPPTAVDIQQVLAKDSTLMKNLKQFHCNNLFKASQPVCCDWVTEKLFVIPLMQMGGRTWDLLGLWNGNFWPRNIFSLIHCYLQNNIISFFPMYCDSKRLWNIYYTHSLSCPALVPLAPFLSVGCRRPDRRTLSLLLRDPCMWQCVLTGGSINLVPWQIKHFSVPLESKSFTKTTFLSKNLQWIWQVVLRWFLRKHLWILLQRLGSPHTPRKRSFGSWESMN